VSETPIHNLLTVKETSEYLRIPLPTVYYLVQRGKIPAIQIGGRWRIKKSSLDRDVLRLDKQGQPTVLVVDDDPVLQDLFQTFLKKSASVEWWSARPRVNDKRGELTIFYVAHEDGVPNGYAENNRTKQVIRWKATGQHLSPEAKADLTVEAEQKRYARKQAERELYEATAQRLGEELRINNSGVKQTQHHKAKQIEATPGAPSRNGDVLVPGYDVDGKLWTIQYIKEDGTKRFAKDSRKHTDVFTWSVRRMARRRCKK